MSKYSVLINDRYGIGDYLRTIGRHDLFVSADALDEFLALIDETDLVYEMTAEKIGELDEGTLGLYGLVSEAGVQAEVDDAHEEGYERGFGDALDIVADWLGNDKEITLGALSEFEAYARHRVKGRQ